jgi:hypothetical protein
MRAKDIIIGESYRHKDNPNYAWAKVVKILKPNQCENTLNRIVVKCEYSVDKNPEFGLIKYFSPANLVKAETNTTQ